MKRTTCVSITCLSAILGLFAFGVWVGAAGMVFLLCASVTACGIYTLATETSWTPEEPPQAHDEPSL